MKTTLYILTLLSTVSLCTAVETAIQNDTIKNRRLMCAYVLQIRTNPQDIAQQHVFKVLELVAGLEKELDAAHLNDSLVKKIAYQAWRSRHMNGTLALPSYLQALTVLPDTLINALVIAHINRDLEKELLEKAKIAQQQETVINHIWRFLKV